MVSCEKQQEDFVRDMADLKGLLQQVLERLDSQGSQIAGLGEHSADFGSQLAAVEASLGGLSADVRTVGTRLDQWEQKQRYYLHMVEKHEVEIQKLKETLVKRGQS